MKNLYILILASIIQFSCISQEVIEKSRSLEPVLKEIKTIDPNNENFSDLQFLKKIIERDSVQVILLGEQTHGDGSTFLAKSRIIKFLHKEAGFDVLAFESGIFNCTYAWEKIRQNGNYEEEISKAVFHMWVNSNECSTLINYLQSTLAGSNPVELTGFDPRLTANQNCQLLIDGLFYNRLDFLTQGEKNLIVKIICFDIEVLSGKDKTYNNSVMEKLINGLDSLSRLEILPHLESLHPNDNLPGPDNKFEYWKHVMEGVKVSYNSDLTSKYEKVNLNDAEILNARDVQMGKNLVWLAKNKYKNRKIIVWASNFHCFRNSEELTSTVEALKFIDAVNKKTITMGDILYDSLQSRIYSIGFTQYTGKRKNLQNNKTEDIPDYSDLSFENVISSVGNEYSFVDLRDTNNPVWLKEEFISSLRSGKDLNGKWKNVTDGIFYIKEMKPVTFGNE